MFVNIRVCVGFFFLVHNTVETVGGTAAEDFRFLSILLLLYRGGFFIFVFGAGVRRLPYYNDMIYTELPVSMKNTPEVFIGCPSAEPGN